MENKKAFSTPITFIFFNRPECTKKVLSVIKEVRPEKLYLVSDGPRNEQEKKIVLEIRKDVLGEIDWKCDIHKNFSDENLGCRNRVSSGISWVFETEEKSIILEDDCVPDISFFSFCDELLEKYKNDNRVMTISGNLNIPDYNPCYSYVFSRFLHVWGWATWKRAWDLYDIEMRDYPRNKKIMKWLPNKLRMAKINEMDLVYYQELDTWDFQWQYCIWKNDGLCIKPNVNTIENIGFDELATHTKTKNKLLDKLVYSEITFPLVHPASVELDTGYEKELIRIYDDNSPPAIESLLRHYYKMINRKIRVLL